MCCFCCPYLVSNGHTALRRQKNNRPPKNHRQNIEKTQKAQTHTEKTRSNTKKHKKHETTKTNIKEQKNTDGGPYDRWIHMTDAFNHIFTFCMPFRSVVPPFASRRLPLRGPSGCPRESPWGASGRVGGSAPVASRVASLWSSVDVSFWVIP